MMFRRGTCVVALFLTWIVAALASARAADDVLKIIPDNALAWGTVHRLADTDAKILKIGEALQIPPVSPLQQIQNITGAKEGLDEQGIAGVIVMPGAAAKSKKAEPTPSLVIVVPVTDYKKFLANFHPEKPADKVVEVQVAGKDILIGNRGKFALIGMPADRKALESVLDAKQSVAAEVAGLESWFGQNDIDLVATEAGVKLFAGKARNQLKETIKMFDNLGENEQITQAKVGIQFYIHLVDAIEKEVSLVAVGGRIDKEGNLRVVKRVRFTKGGQFREALAGVKPVQSVALDGLPGGAFVFAMAGSLPQSSANGIVAASIRFMKQNPGLYGLTAEQVEKLVKISTESVMSVSKMSIVMKPPKRGEPLYSNIFGTFEVDDSAKFFDKYEKQIAQTNEIVKESKTGMIAKTAVKRIEIGGKPALELQMTMPVPKSSVAVPNMEQLMEKFIGPGGKGTAYLATADTKTVVFGFNVPKSKVADLMTSVKTPKAGLGGDAELAITSAMLPHDALWTGYASPRGCVNFFAQLMATTFAVAMPDGSGPQFNLPAFPKTPPVGATLKIVSGELDGELAIPIAVFKGIGEYRTQVMQGIMNQPATP